MNLSDHVKANAILGVPRRSELTRNGAHIMTFGDSFAAASVADGGSGYPASQAAFIAPMLEAISLGKFRFDHANMRGVSGNTTTQMLARYAADVAASYDNFDILLVQGGRNDGHTALSDANTTVANLTAICEQARMAGKKVWLEIPNPPRTTGITTDTQRKIRGNVNQRMQEYCRSTSGAVVYMDFWRDWVDPAVSTGVAATSVLHDGLHADCLGAYRAAKRILDTVGSQYPEAPRNAGAWDWYDATNNPKGNILSALSTTAQRLIGTTGTAGTGTSGSIATGWKSARYSGTGTQVVFSKEAAAAGYGNAGTDKQVVTVSTLSGDFYGPFATDYFSTPAGLLGLYVFAQIEVEVTDLVGCTNINMGMYHNNGSTAKGSFGFFNGLHSNLPLPNGKYLIRTQPMLVENVTNVMWAEACFGFSSGGSGVLKFSAPEIRVVA